MKKLIFIIVCLVLFTSCVENKKRINPPQPDPNTDDKVRTNYGMKGEFRGDIHSDVRDNIEVYSVTDERTGNKYLLFSNGDGVCVIEVKEKETKENYYEDR